MPPEAIQDRDMSVAFRPHDFFRTKEVAIQPESTQPNIRNAVRAGPNRVVHQTLNVHRFKGASLKRNTIIALGLSAIGVHGSIRNLWNDGQAKTELVDLVIDAARATSRDLGAERSQG
jgi:hypothetical protein